MVRYCHVPDLIFVLTLGVALAQPSWPAPTSSLLATYVPGGHGSSSTDQTNSRDGVVTDKTQTYSTHETNSPPGMGPADHQHAMDAGRESARAHGITGGKAVGALVATRSAVIWPAIRARSPMIS